jgi:hypothetical protein
MGAMSRSLCIVLCTKGYKKDLSCLTYDALVAPGARLADAQNGLVALAVAPSKHAGLVRVADGGIH